MPSGSGSFVKKLRAMRSQKNGQGATGVERARSLSSADARHSAAAVRWLAVAWRMYDTCRNKPRCMTRCYCTVVVHSSTCTLGAWFVRNRHGQPQRAADLPTYLLATCTGWQHCRFGERTYLYLPTSHVLHSRQGR